MEFMLPLGTVSTLTSIRRMGYLQLVITKALALTATINVVMYAESDNVIEIDRNRQVLFDYSA
jgi:hypothetical protein